MKPEVLNISGVEIPYFFGLSAKMALEDEIGKDSPDNLKETLQMHYVNYKEGCRIRKAEVKLSFTEFVDLLDTDLSVNMEIINKALETFSQGKK